MSDKNILSYNSNNLSKNKTMVTKSPSLQSVAAELSVWRSNKKFPSQPFPKTIKEQIFHLIAANQNQISQVVKTLNISRVQIKSIVADVKNALATNSKKTTFSPDIELIPFQLMPKQNTTQESIQPDTNCQSQTQTLIKKDTPHSQSNNSGDNIIINSASGSNLYLPTNLSEETIYKIIQLFLCSK